MHARLHQVPNLLLSLLALLVKKYKYRRLRSCFTSGSEGRSKAVILSLYLLLTCFTCC